MVIKRAKKITPPDTVDELEPARLGSQTLFRGLDVVEVVAEGEIPLSDLAVRLGLTRSTTHRLASALVDRRYLTFTPRSGYSLGPKLIELGYKVRDKLDLPKVAAPYLQELAAITEDTVQLGILDRGRVLYLDKVPGKRRVSISSRIGEVQPVTITGLGKALILDRSEKEWRHFFTSEKGEGLRRQPYEEWMRRMRKYVETGCAFDLEENEDRIRCIAAPVRDVEGLIAAGISVSCAAQYMDETRMKILAKEVLHCAAQISRDLGWSGPIAKPVPKAEGKTVLEKKKKATQPVRKVKARAGR
ncbi:MAG: IclR family transcriptional regulator [Rhizomicrobium sp.]